MQHDVIIIGGGPAGCTTALQLRRQDFNVLLVEQHCIGGLLHHANLVENFPGHWPGLSGRDLAGRFENQLSGLDVTVLRMAVTGLTEIQDGLAVETVEGRFFCRHAVIATGTVPQKNYIWSLPNRLGSLIFDDPEKAESVNGPLAIVGGGDAAFDYALRLSVDRSVHILMRSEPRALPLLIRRAAENKNIVVHDHFDVQSVDASEIGLHITGGNQSLDVSGILLAVGRRPALDFLQPHLVKWQNHERCHFVGDAVNGLERQAAIAAGDGLRLAMRLTRILEGEI